MVQNNRVWQQIEQGKISNLNIYEKVNKMTEMPQMQEIDWKDVDFDGKFIKIADGDSKDMTTTNWGLRLRNTDFSDEEKEEFYCDVVDIDGKSFEKDPKVFTTMSKPLMKKLQPIYQNKQKNDLIKVRISRDGSGKDTTYIVKELK